MRICYIAHPIGGDIEANLADLRRIIRKINLQYKYIVPFCPYYADIVSLDDNVPDERQRGIENDTTILWTGIAQELWLTGERISPGMEAERDLALALGMKVIDHINKL